MVKINKNQHITKDGVIKNNPQRQKSIEMVKALNKLISITYGVSIKKANDIVGRASEYNVNNMTDIFEVIESEFGYKPKIW